MNAMNRGRWIGIGVLIAFFGLAWLGWRAARPTVTAAALILDLTNQQRPVRKWLPVHAQSVTTRDIDVPARHGAVRARLFTPEFPQGTTLAIFPGVNGGGNEEPRMN
jgi:hypothetical protein